MSCKWPCFWRAFSDIVDLLCSKPICQIPCSFYSTILDFDGVTNVTQCKDYKCGGHQGTHIGHIQVEEALKHGLSGIHHATDPVRLLQKDSKKWLKILVCCFIWIQKTKFIIADLVLTSTSLIIFFPSDSELSWWIPKQRWVQMDNQSGRRAENTNHNTRNVLSR